jgi:hypothetical protein
LVDISIKPLDASRLSVKTFGKIPRNTSSIFHIFRSFLYYSVNTVIGMKMEYGVAGNGRNTVGLPYRLFLDWVGKFGNFSDSHTVHLGFLALFIWVGSAIFFLLIQRVFKYLNDSNLQNKKLVLTELKKFKIWQVERLLHIEQIFFLVKLQIFSRF